MIKASGPPSPKSPSFVVTVANNGEERVTVQITGTTAEGVYKTRVFELGTKEHKEVRNFHDEVAETFGLRTDSAAKSQKPREGGPPLVCLLDASVDERIHYGYGDPCIIRIQGETGDYLFHLAVTSNDAPDKFPILTSADLKSWHLSGFAFDRAKSPVWAAEGENQSDYWAPEIHRVGTEYVLCFAARDSDGSLSVGLARANRVTGPFLAQKVPIVSGNVIDPHIFVDDDTAYLFWKVDNNDRWPIELIRLFNSEPGLITSVFTSESDRGIVRLACAMGAWAESATAMERFFILQPMIAIVTSRYAAVREALTCLCEDATTSLRQALRNIIGLMETPVMAQRLDPVSLTLLGQPQVVLKNDQPWEAHLIEGIWITRNQDRYYACYSGNDFSTTDYGIGVAVANSPLGPFRKMDGPLIHSTEQWVGPGHPCIVQGRDGKPVMVLHGYRKGETGYKAFRALLALPIDFTMGGISTRQAAV